MKPKTKKILTKLAIGMFITALCLPIGTASAGTTDIGNFSDFNSQFDPLNPMNDVMSDMGVDKEEMKNTIQTINVARRKEQQPQVSLSFNPANPVPGQKVIATATPMYFLNDNKNLYFTWFLKQKDCERTNSPSEKEKEKCDLNDDGKVDIEDYKIKAARIIASSDFDWENADYSDNRDNDSYTASYGGNDQAGKNAHCYVHDVKSGDEYEIGCAHLFPNAPGQTTGDGVFGIKEEQFWHTDPGNDDTAQTGNGDEANVAGLGESSFSWNYGADDEVGLVVEGISINPTQDQDSSYRTMWAMPKSSCDFSGDINEYPKTTSNTTTSDETDPADPTGNTVIRTETTITTKEELTGSAESTGTVQTTVQTRTVQKSIVTDPVTGEETETITSDQTVTNSTSTSTVNLSGDIVVKDGNSNTINNAEDLNKCLYDNLIRPEEGGGTTERLNINLSYSPQNPMNDPAGTDGDELSVKASVPNSESEYLKYIWQVYTSDEPNPDSWGDPLLKSDLPGSSQSSGIGISTFSFKLNFNNPKKYFRVKVTAQENVSSSSYREGHADIVIPVSSVSDRIKAYGTSVSDDLKVNMNDSEICTDGLDEAICPVAKDQIIGVKVNKGDFTDFLWTVNGNPVTYSECFFDGCDSEEQGNAAYFPVLNDNGSKYTISVAATNIKTGEKLELTRVFQVSEPKISIVSNDTEVCTPVLQGYFTDLNGKLWPDYSETNFEAGTDKNIKLKVETVGFSNSSASANWFADENPIMQTSSSGTSKNYSGSTLALSPKSSGESYSVSVATVYAPDQNLKKALNKYWGVSYSQFYEKQISANINIAMSDYYSSSTQAKAPTKKVMASLYSSVPAYLAFLFRIILTAFIILFTSGLVLSFSPNTKENEI